MMPDKKDVASELEEWPKGIRVLMRQKSLVKY
jgi:hypothetical protein